MAIALKVGGVQEEVRYILIQVKLKDHDLLEGSSWHIIADGELEFNELYSSHHLRLCGHRRIFSLQYIRSSTFVNF